MSDRPGEWSIQQEITIHVESGISDEAYNPFEDETSPDSFANDAMLLVGVLGLILLFCLWMITQGNGVITVLAYFLVAFDIAFAAFKLASVSMQMQTSNGRNNNCQSELFGRSEVVSLCC